MKKTSPTAGSPGQKATRAWGLLALVAALAIGGWWMMWGSREPQPKVQTPAPAPRLAPEAELADRVAPAPRGPGSGPAKIDLVQPTQPSARGVQMAPPKARPAPQVVVDPVSAPGPQMLAPSKDGSLPLAVDAAGVAVLPDGTKVQTRPAHARAQAGESGRDRALREQERARQAAMEESSRAQNLDGNGNPLPMTPQQWMARQR